MTTDRDEFDDLRAAMTAATPRPDAGKRAENLRLAQQNFDALQGSRNAARPNPATAPKGLWQGVGEMLKAFTTKGGLTVTTAIVACGVLILTPQGRSVWQDPEFTVTEGDTVLTDQVAGSELAAEERAEDESGLALAAPEPAAAPLAPPPQARSVQPLGEGMDALMAEPAPTAHSDFIELGPDTEAYPSADTNPLKVVVEEPVSTFSIDVDTAAYSVIRNSLNRGTLPPAEAVRVEEMVNYFPYDYPAPDADAAPFRPTISLMPTPWNPDTQLLHIALQGELPAVDDRPPLNLVFLIDTSGSMNDAAKLPLLKQSFRLMLGNLSPEDQVAIVEYAGSAGLVLAPTPAGDRTAILAALDGLGAGGSTNGQGGLEQAYAVAATMAEEGEVSRVILATDGDFNVGLSDPSALEDFIADKRETGTYLSVLGFGRGNLDDATMQALAQNGNGTAAYIDTLNEAQKVLVDQLTGALFPIAGDVKVQVEFNPATVAEYRLIGYETRALNREDFNNDRVDAGELGAGHSVTAIYEITPVGSPARMTDPLRYQPAADAGDSPEIGFLKLRWKEPGEDVSQLIETPILPDMGSAGTEAQFAAAIAGFGQLLRGDTALGDWGWAEAIALANANRGTDPYGYRTEAVQLMRLAESLSAR
ncbi:VWA domain-containing protein [Loktanella sp. IMCC34160]|uniref:vWA domain-containing protein n=1 Tax=Loktanella sp. IMCC34160 TaxID=2510646 RepID=UPI00101D5A00|nr:VWA domain-containing protein [Loktanella sp. IMCC34160]RYG92978.1 VWA domain-containing protein [Loktanella sp. IMCC34160]